MASTKIYIQDSPITILTIDKEDYISLTDMAHSQLQEVTGFFQYLIAENRQKEVPRFLYIYTNGAFGANFPQKKNDMKKLSLFLLSLFLCSMSVPILAQDTELVPAMVVQMADGSKQVVQLEHTVVTDFGRG